MGLLGMKVHRQNDGTWLHSWLIPSNCHLSDLILLKESIDIFRDWRQGSTLYFRMTKERGPFHIKTWSWGTTNKMIQHDHLPLPCPTNYLMINQFIYLLSAILHMEAEGSVPTAPATTLMIKERGPFHIKTWLQARLMKRSNITTYLCLVRIGIYF
jgi:hypothetical protein